MAYTPDAPLRQWLPIWLAFVAGAMVFFCSKIPTTRVCSCMLYTGKLTAVIQKTLGIDEVPQAIGELKSRHVRGKLVVLLSESLPAELE